jgi:prophage antirepressor-like protein
VSTDLTPFDFRGARVRVITVDDEPRFVAVDVCMVLGLNNPRSSLALLDDEEKDVHVVDTPGGPQQMTTVDESGLYSLVLRSRKPEAREFKRWITREVLPAIRKTGSYGTVRELTRLELIDLARESEVARLNAVAERDALEPAARSWTQLAEAKGDYSLRDAAHILNRDPSIRTGQNRLSKWLKNCGWTDHSGRPYQRHVEAGRLVVRSRSYDHPLTGEPQATTQLRVTVKGLHDLHREMGGSGPLLLEVPA